MNLESESQDQGFKIARRFLRTAVVVDDEAQMMPNGENGTVRRLAPPDRRSQVPSQIGEKTIVRQSRHSLNASSVINSFSNLGIVCGVIGPNGSEMETMRQADIVVLDWNLKVDDRLYALKLLRKLLSKKEDRNALRLVVIYTGEAMLNDIGTIVYNELANADLGPSKDETNTTISYRHGAVVLYAKSDVNLAKPFEDRSVAEESLPKKLVQDFASMTSGLLPSIALTSLTAVREGEHRVLDQFCSKLDPAFLAQRACLPDPADAERQIVNNVVEELRSLMHSSVADFSPAGDKAIEHWIKNKADGDEKFKFVEGKRELNTADTYALAKTGLRGDILKNNNFKGLSAGFSGLSISDAEELDKRLAWIMSFRTVHNTPPPILWLGTVVTTDSPSGTDQHLICMRPRCDCVRLNGERNMFLFLPLLVANQRLKNQIVVKIKSKFERLGIGLDPEGWVFGRFKSTESSPVIATKSVSSNDFEFKDTDGTRYVWRGELKPEFAQRIAQILATTLSRAAVDESEWLRRMAK